LDEGMRLMHFYGVWEDDGGYYPGFEGHGFGQWNNRSQYES